MSDPAIEGARRAMKAVHGYPTPNYDMIIAAREVLKPIQKAFEDLSERAQNLYGCGVPEDARAAGIDAALDELAPLIFYTEELER